VVAAAAVAMSDDAALLEQLFDYVPEHQLLVCKKHRHAIPDSELRIHLSSGHGLNFRAYRSICRAIADQSLSTIPTPEALKALASTFGDFQAGSRGIWSVRAEQLRQEVLKIEAGSPEI
jgi:hypothetical protein